MDLEQSALDNMRIAIGLLGTAFLDKERLAPELFDMLREGLDQPGFDVRAIAGMINVSTILLAKLQELTGATPHELLREIGVWVEQKSASPHLG